MTTDEVIVYCYKIVNHAMPVHGHMISYLTLRRAVPCKAFYPLFGNAIDVFWFTERYSADGEHIEKTEERLLCAWTG